MRSGMSRPYGTPAAIWSAAARIGNNGFAAMRRQSPGRVRWTCTEEEGAEDAVPASFTNSYLWSAATNSAQRDGPRLR